MSAPTLKRTLGLAECVFFGVGAILGGGIYALVGKVAGLAGNMVWLAFLIASLTAVFSAFAYAELSAAFPKAGGEYVYAKEALGHKWGMATGFIISINGILSGATVALGFAGYFTQLLDINLILAALGIIVLIFIVNASGIRQSSIINIIFTVIELAGLLFVIYVARDSVGKVNYLEFPPNGFHGLLTAAALSYFAYMGLEEIVKLAEETKKPEKTIPRALFISAAIVVVIYLMVAIAAVSVLGWEELAQSESPLADVIGTEFGQTGITILVVVALFSTSNTILSNMLGASRVIYTMAQENKRMGWLSKVSSRSTPITALAAVLLIMGGFAFIGKIEVVAYFTNALIFIAFMLTNVSLIVLRIKKKDLKRPFRVPGNIRNIPVITVLAIFLSLLLFIYVIVGLSQGIEL